MPALQELLQIVGSPHPGTASYDSNLLTATAPAEGVWVPMFFVQEGSIELEGSFSAASVQLIGSNAVSWPDNLYTVTVGGTITATDVLTLTFSNANLPTGSKALAYTVQGGDSTTTIATALAAAINADTDLAALGFHATSASAVVTVAYLSFPPGNDGSQEGPSQTQSAYQNATAIAGTLSSGATETLTVASASVGGNIGSALTAKGITALSTLPKWIKAVLASFTGTSIAINLHGVG